MGMYANRTLYLNIENHTLKEVDFNITGISPIIDYKDELEVAFYF